MNIRLAGHETNAIALGLNGVSKHISCSDSLSFFSLRRKLPTSLWQDDDDETQSIVFLKWRMSNLKTTASYIFWRERCQLTEIIKGMNFTELCYAHIQTASSYSFSQKYVHTTYSSSNVAASIMLNLVFVFF